MVGGLSGLREIRERAASGEYHQAKNMDDGPTDTYQALGRLYTNVESLRGGIFNINMPEGTRVHGTLRKLFAPAA